MTSNSLRVYSRMWPLLFRSGFSNSTGFRPSASLIRFLSPAAFGVETMILSEGRKNEARYLSSTGASSEMLIYNDAPVDTGVFSDGFLVNVNTLATTNVVDGLQLMSFAFEAYTPGSAAASSAFTSTDLPDSAAAWDFSALTRQRQFTAIFGTGGGNYTSAAVGKITSLTIPGAPGVPDAGATAGLIAGVLGALAWGRRRVAGL